MNYMKATIGGLVGGLIGAAVWAAITWATNYEISIIASAIGAAVGFGVRLGAGEESGEGYGGLAIVLSLLAILSGKYLAAELVHNSNVQKVIANAPKSTDETMMTEIAEEIAGARADANLQLAWPPGKHFDNAEVLADYPPDVVQEAMAKWNANPPSEKDRLKSESDEKTRIGMTNLMGLLDRGRFFSSFSFYDILWFGVAGLAAFKIGSGLASDDD